jgi:hypothetical protein
MSQEISNQTPWPTFPKNFRLDLSEEPKIRNASYNRNELRGNKEELSLTTSKSNTDWADNTIFIEELSHWHAVELGLKEPNPVYDRLSDPNEDPNLMMEFWALEGASQRNMLTCLESRRLNQVPSMDLVPA